MVDIFFLSLSLYFSLIFADLFADEYTVIRAHAALGCPGTVKIRVTNSYFIAPPGDPIRSIQYGFFTTRTMKKTKIKGGKKTRVFANVKHHVPMVRSHTHTRPA